MLKLLRLSKISLITVLFALIFAVGASGSLLFLLHSSDVEKLVKHYPVYNKELRKYELSLKKPVDWVKIKDVSEYSRWAIIVSEDWAYYEHTGFDYRQIRIAVGESIKQARLVRGASTITQQVIKNLILGSERTLWRKFRELILSYKVEKLLSKDKILEIYLNMVELGDGIYGISKAARYYFNKKPSVLTAREGAFLAMLLPSPVKYASSFKRKEVSVYANKIITSILIKLRQAKVYTEEQRIVESQKLFYWEKQVSSDSFEYNYYE